MGTKKEDPEKKMMTGICKYCGQAQNVEASTKEEANKKATETCNCDRAIIEKNYMEFCNAISDLVFAQKEDTGFTPLSNDDYKMICVMADKLIRHEIQGMTIKLSDRILKLSLDKDGNAKFRQSKTVEVGVNG